VWERRLPHPLLVAADVARVAVAAHAAVLVVAVRLRPQVVHAVAVVARRQPAAVAAGVVGSTTLYRTSRSDRAASGQAAQGRS
jgi:hypothetical protein